jgi:hypothetical protein
MIRDNRHPGPYNSNLSGESCMNSGVRLCVVLLAACAAAAAQAATEYHYAMLF